MHFDKLWFRWDEARALGNADKATIIEFIRWSIHYKESNSGDYMKVKYFFDGHWWMQDSIKAWQERIPWLSERTIRRYLHELCETGWLVSKESTDRYGGKEPNFYRLTNLSGGGGIIAPLPPREYPLSHDVSTPSRKMDAATISKNQTTNQAMSRPEENPPTPPAAGAESFFDEFSFLGEEGSGKREAYREEESGRGGIETSDPCQSIPSQKKCPSVDPSDRDLAEEWLEFAKQEMKWKVPPSSWTIPKFSEAISSFRRATGMTPAGAKDLLAFIKTDDFWRLNALSPAGLLSKSKNGSRKIDNILIRMKPKKSFSEKIMDNLGKLELEKYEHLF